METLKLLQILLNLLLQQSVIMECKILGPSNLHSCVGCAAVFKFTTADGNKIYSAKWGIRKGNIPEPRFIYIDVRRSIPIINEDYRNKVAFVGNLTAGRAWFILKNLTINDTNEYIAVIRDDASGPIPYPLELEVRDQMDIISTFPTTTLSPFPSKTIKPTTTKLKEISSTFPTSTSPPTRSTTIKLTTTELKVPRNDRIIVIVCVLTALLFIIVSTVVFFRRKMLFHSLLRDPMSHEVEKGLFEDCSKDQKRNEPNGKKLEVNKIYRSDDGGDWLKLVVMPTDNVPTKMLFHSLLRDPMSHEVEKGLFEDCSKDQKRNEPNGKKLEVNKIYRSDDGGDWLKLVVMPTDNVPTKMLFHSLLRDPMSHEVEKGLFEDCSKDQKRNEPNGKKLEVNKICRSDDGGDWLEFVVMPTDNVPTVSRPRSTHKGGQHLLKHPK